MSIELLENKLITNNQLLARVLEFYELSPLAGIRLLNYSENMTYLVEDSIRKTKTILRVNRPGYHPKEGIEAELEWMEAIAGNSPISVPKPIAGKNGEYVQVLKSDNILSQYCVMISFLEGDAPDENGIENLIIQFEKLGEVTARLHEHVLSWEKSNTMKRFVWDYESMLGETARWGQWKEGPDVSLQQIVLFQRVSDTIQRRLKKFGKSRDRFGLVHADLRLANLLIEGDKIKVIDFDDCGYSWFLYDLGAAVSFIEHYDYIPDLINSWIKGYRKIRVLSAEEETEIPTFIMLRRLMLLAWLGTHRDSDTARELGSDFAANTVGIAEKYLCQFDNR